MTFRKVFVLPIICSLLFLLMFQQHSTKAASRPFKKVATYKYKYIQDGSRKATPIEIMGITKEGVLMTVYHPREKIGSEITFYNKSGKVVYDKYYNGKQSVGLQPSSSNDYGHYFVISPKYNKLYMLEWNYNGKVPIFTLLTYDLKTLKLKRARLNLNKNESIDGSFGSNKEGTILYFYDYAKDGNGYNILSVNLSKNYELQRTNVSYEEKDNDPNSEWYNIESNDSYLNYPTYRNSVDYRSDDMTNIPTSFDSNYKQKYGKNAFIGINQTERYDIGNKVYYYRTYDMWLKAKPEDKWLKSQGFMLMADKNEPKKILKVIDANKLVLNDKYNGFLHILDNQTFLLSYFQAKQTAILDSNLNVVQKFSGHFKQYTNDGYLLLQDPTGKTITAFKR